MNKDICKKIYNRCMMNSLELIIYSLCVTVMLQHFI